MKAFQLMNAGEMGQLRDVPIPSPAPGEVLSKTASNRSGEKIARIRLGFNAWEMSIASGRGRRTEFIIGSEPAA
jgi:hypothetical protein